MDYTKQNKNNNKLNIMARNTNKRKKHDDGGKNLLYVAIAIVAVAIVGAFLLWPSKKHYISEEQGVVREVINGNTIELTNGLKVTLLGVEPSTKSQEFLKKNLVNQEVRLIVDSSNPKKYYEDASNETVSAYVRTTQPANFSNVNGYMIREGICGFLNSYCNDSVNVFTEYAKHNTKPTGEVSGLIGGSAGMLLSEEDLGKKMSAATFLITGETEEGDMIIGTGFFINKNGLALTNYHVLAQRANYRIFISDEEGHITQDRDRPIARLITADRGDDYAIFWVQLDNGEEVPYLDLAKERPKRGTRVGVVGNPATDSGVFLATFTTGQISALREEAGLIQFDASVTNGNSGGPVCDYYGRVLGIAKSVALKNGQQNAADLNFGVDIQLVREVLDKLKDVKTYGGK